MDRLRESCALTTLTWGISSGFPLADHFDLLGSESIFSISQDPPMRACASLSQDGFYRRGIWAKHLLTSLPFRPPKSLSAHVWVGRSPDLRLRNMWSQGPASSVNCPAILSWNFSPQGMKLQLLYSWGVGGGAGRGVSTSCLKITKKTVNHGLIKLIQKRIEFVGLV